MSFFIRPQNSIKRNNKILEKKGKGKKRKFENHSNKKRKQRQDDEEIESDEDEPAYLPRDGREATYESDDNIETAQEKKLRLAKLYLEEIERKEKRSRENGEVSKDDITNYLKEDLKEKTSKIRKAVADTYSGFDEAHIRFLSCKEHYLPLTCIVVSFDNKYIYSGSKDSSIVKWSLELGKKLNAVRDRKNADGTKKRLGNVLCLAISTDNKFLVSGSSIKEINVWNPDNLQHLHTFSGHKDAVTGVAIQRNHPTLFSASADKSVKVWNLTEMSYVESLFGHQKGVTAIDVLSAERPITSGGDSSVHLWKIVEESQLIYNSSGSVDCVKYVNDENFITCGSDGSLCCWGVLKKSPRCTIQNAHGIDVSNLQPNWLSCVGTLVNTDLIASGSCNGIIKLWKCRNDFRDIQMLFEIPMKGFVNGLHFTNDGQFLIAAVGSEHRLGRWWKLKEVKSRVVVIPLIKKCP